MGDLTATSGSGIIGVLHGGGGLDLPQPFEREIFLFYTHVAGTRYIAGIEELEPFLNVDDKLDFFREPENEYDKRAIVIKTNNGVKIGYVPRCDNIVFSRLMDAGKLIFGKITDKSMNKNWLEIKIAIYLKE